MCNSRTCIAVLLLLATFLARAESVADLDPAKVAAIRELLEVTGAHADQKQLSRTFSPFLNRLRSRHGGYMARIGADCKVFVAESDWH